MRLPLMAIVVMRIMDRLRLGDVYVLGSPLFKSVTLQLPDNKRFLIKSVERSKGSELVESVQLNGKKMEGFELPFAVFRDNGNLTFFKN